MKTRHDGQSGLDKSERIRRGDDFWRDALARQAASALTQRAFCEREGLSIATFAAKRRALGYATSLSPVSGQRTSVPAFIEIGRTVALPSEPQPHADAQDRSAALHVRLELVAGLVLEIHRG